MVVKFSRPFRSVTSRPGWTWGIAIACGLLAWHTSPAPSVAQEDLVARSEHLRDEARAAKTLEQQNQVLEKIEQMRQGNVSEPVKKYLISLQAWLLHQRGETYSQKAAEADKRGDTRVSKDLDAKAMEDFDAAVTLDPQRWKSYHHRGVCYALAGKFQEALSDFSKTIELRPDYDKAWFNRGEVHYELGDYAKAVADYDAAIRLQADDAGFYTSRGNAYFQLRRFPQALGDYSKAVSLDPNNSEYFANRGDAYRSLGDWEKAAKDFSQAIKLNKRFGRAYQSAAWLMATCPDPQFRNAELAVRSAEQAIELDGSGEYIYLDTLAAALANSGQFERAQEVQGRAIELSPPENVAPLKERLRLYGSRKPYRQDAGAIAQRATRKPRRS